MTKHQRRPQAKKPPSRASPQSTTTINSPVSLRGITSTQQTMDGAFMAESAPPLRPNGNHHNLSAVTPTTTTTTTLTSPGGILGSFLRARPSRDPSDQRTSPNDLLRTPPTPSSGFSHILRRRRSGGQIAPNSPPVPPVPSRPAPSLPTSASVPNAPSLPVPTGSYTAPSTTTMPQQAPPAALSAANVTTALAGVGGPPTNAGDGPPGPSHRLRLVPQIDNRRSLRFDPISRDVPEGSAALRIGRFTDRSGLGVSAANALGSNKLAFKSKVVSRAHAEIWCERGGKFFIRDTRSSSGTFLNHVRLSAANADSRPFEIRDGDTLQLGVDYQGGAEDIYKCVRIRVEIGREWQAGANAFNTNALKQLRALSNPTGGKAAPDKKSAHTAVSHGKSGFSDCCICLFSVTIQQALFIAPCSHSFHYKCIRPLLESHHPAFSCPLCRTFADLEEDVEIEGGDGASLAPSAEAEEDDEEDKVSSAVAPGGLGRPSVVIPAPVLIEDDEDADDMDVYEDAQVPSSAPVLPASAASIRSIHSGHSIHSASQPSLHSHSHSHGHLPAHYDGFSHSFEGVARHGPGDGFDPYEAYSRPSMDTSLAHSHSHSQGQEVDDDRMLGVPEEPAPAYDDIQGPGHRASPLNHIRSGGGGSGGLLATPRIGSAGYGDVPVDRRAESDSEEARDVLGSLGGEIRRRR